MIVIIIIMVLDKDDDERVVYRGGVCSHCVLP